MDEIKEFIAQQEREIKIKREKVLKLKASEPMHEYVILNNAWIDGEENILNKLKKLV